MSSSETFYFYLLFIFSVGASSRFGAGWVLAVIGHSADLV